MPSLAKLPTGEHPPIIDISNFEERKDEIVAQLMDAAQRLGFFYLAGHGMSQDLVDAAFEQCGMFFDKPNEYKDSFPKVDWGRAKVLGYERNNLTDGTVHESFLHQYECHEEMAIAWPKEDLPEYRDITLEFMNNCQAIAARVLSGFAIGLGFPEDFFQQMIKVDTAENHTFLQYHRYPSVANLKYKPGTQRYTAHTDESIMTLLFPSPGSVGLEVAPASAGKEAGQDGYYSVEEWTQCPQIDGCITVNCGDPLQMWSDGRCKSNFHRVRMPRGDESREARHSIGYFIWPLLDTVIKGPQGKYKSQTMREFMEYKGKMYAASFSQDTEELESVQSLVFGNPVKDLQVQVGA